MKVKKLTRRDFLMTAAVAPFASAVGCSCLTCPKPVPGVPPAAGRARITSMSHKSRVVLIRDAAAVGENRATNAAVIRKMLDDAVTTLFGESDPVAAWKHIVGPGDTVGVKTNIWKYLATGPELEEAIRGRLVDAGVSADRIAIADRGVLDNPIFQQATVLINARPARVHYWAGMGSCLKNYIMFVPKPSDYHDDACANLGAIWKLPPVKDRTRLNILSMLTPQYHNIGPRGFSEQYLWTYGGLIVGQDVVAVDATGYSVIRAKRLEVFGEDKPLETSAHHIQLADTRHGLGKSNPDDIELIRLGWDEKILI
ncbi:MAG: DUF362 domain-containing protein [Candidatus Aminicenantales bacterium]